MRGLTTCASLGLAVLACCTAFAQSYPSKPIRLIAGYVPGGGADSVSRLLAAKLSEVLSQQIIVDNRPGANGVIAGEMVAKGTPDGYTLHMVTSSHAINPIVYRNIPYDTIKDFATVSELAIAALIMVVHPSTKASNVPEFVALAKGKPAELHYGSAGVGNITQLAAELFSSMTGIKLLHVPYKGSGPAIIDVISGQIAVYFPPLPSGLPQVRAGKLKALAVTGSARSLAAPGIPTVAESGLAGYEAGSWYGMVAPARTPRDIINTLHSASVRVLQSADTQERMKSQGLDPVGSSPAEFEAKIKRDIDKWRKVFQEANIKME